MKESQATISTWANEVFGPAGSDARVAARANEEMAELLRLVTTDNPPPEKLVEEAADVVIILFRFAERLGEDLLQAIDGKMALNRSREWKRDGTGHGYHVRTDKVKS